MEASYPSTPVRIGIDIGGTKIAGIVLTENDTASHLTVVPVAKGNEALLSSLRTLVEQLLLTQYGEQNFQQIPALIGIGIPGQIDIENGVVDDAVNVGISHLALAEKLQKDTRWQICVDNDVNAAALAAVKLLPNSVPVEKATHAYLNLGTGLAAGIIVNGKLVRGAFGAAGEIGHLAVDPHRYPCNCGQYGCLETVASGSAVQRLWPTENGPALPKLIKAASSGNPRAAEVLNTVIHGISTAINALCLTFDPKTVTLGGGLSKTGNPLLSLVQSELKQQAAESYFLESLHITNRVRLAPLGTPMGALGAALLTQKFLVPA